MMVQFLCVLLCPQHKLYAIYVKFMLVSLGAALDSSQVDGCLATRGCTITYIATSNLVQCL